MTTRTPLYQPQQILKYENGQRNQNTANLVQETPLTIILNQNHLTTLVCSPQAYRQLAVGYLLSSGLITNYADIIDLSLDQHRGLVQIQTKPLPPPPRQPHDTMRFSADEIIVSQGLEKINAPASFSAPNLLGLINRLNESSAAFRQTGGVHSAGLSNQNQLLVTYEDIGRHNAVDKVLGQALIENINPSDKCLLLTCRVAVEILIKAARLKVPLVLSRSAPTQLAVELADALHITLVGFARGDSMNLYCHHDRIKD